LYALLSGHLPFDDDNIRQLLNKVKVGKYKIPEHLSDEARDLITKILVINPSKRLTVYSEKTNKYMLV
jgi:serine/threonine protein kinase